MILEVRAVGPFYKNGFVVGCERTREAVLIDPGDEVDELLAAAFEADVQVQRILLTHAHVDHVTGVAAAKEALDVPVHLHRDDLFLYEQAVEHGRMFGLTVRPQPPIDAFYDGSALGFGDYAVTVHHTPGHCPGGVCLQIGRPGAGGSAASLRRRHAVCRVDRPHGSAGRRLRRADAVDYGGVVSAG